MIKAIPVKYKLSVDFVWARFLNLVVFFLFDVVFEVEGTVLTSEVSHYNVKFLNQLGNMLS